MNKNIAIDKAMADVIGILPIRWHITTPTHFSCDKHCCGCCYGSIVFPDEAEKIPPEGLFQKEGLIYLKHPTGLDNGCCFFEGSLDFHCSLGNLRPLRCKLYPYYPVIDINTREIVILADPFLSLLMEQDDDFEDVVRNKWFICYGLGKGKQIKKEVNRLAVEFLRKLALNYANCLSAHFSTDIDSLIMPELIKKHLFPLFPSWKDMKRYTAITHVYEMIKSIL